ncbi:MAG TPA: hypothetical protein VK589_00205 [Chryseolinea sp.]|nr:hypothetical protein [Chryseolinea sp.]
MDQSNQYFFSVKRLKELIDAYDSDTYKKSMGGKELKGFVFIQGADEKGNAALFGFPLFSSNPKPGGDGDILVQNTSPKRAGCPYPPPCRTFDVKEECYTK